MNNTLPQPSSRKLADAINKHLMQPLVDQLAKAQPKDQQKPA